MLCPKCGKNTKSIVLDTRDNTEYVRRRRECSQCGGKFTTYEAIPEQMMNVTKVRKAVRRKLWNLPDTIDKKT